MLKKINCKQRLIFNTVYGRRLSKLFTNFHVSWDTLYLYTENLQFTFTFIKYKYLLLQLKISEYDTQGCISFTQRIYNLQIV